MPFRTFAYHLTRSTQRAQTSTDPEDPDFGLWIPGSEAWSGSLPKLYHLVLEPCPTLQKISSKSVHKFASNPTDRQTNRQTDRTKNITSFFGGGNYWMLDLASQLSRLVSVLPSLHISAWLTMIHYVKNRLWN